MLYTLPSAFFLDLDDTIISNDVNTDQCWNRVVNHFTERYGDVSETTMLTTLDRIRHWYWSDPERHRTGRLDLHTARLNIVNQALTELGISDQTLALEIVDRFAVIREELTIPLPGAIETVKWLRQRATHLALITNGRASEQRRKIERFALSSFFDLIVIEGEFGLGKPDQRVYKHALSQLGIQAQDAWMIGDNFEWDVAAPQRIGMRGVWIDVRSTGLPATATIQPHAIVRELKEVISLFE